MRMIDADALIEKYGEWYTEEGPEEGFIGTVKGIVDKMPTVQPEPCEDAASRQYLLDEYDRQHKGPPGGARKIIEEAPSVTPKQQECEERKEGECLYYARGFCQQVSGDRCNVCSLRGKA